MTERQLIAALIDEYVGLQRIKAADDRDSEIEYQIRVAKTKLNVLGIKTDSLDK